MPDAHTAIYDAICTSSSAASLDLRPMPNAHPSFLGIVSASIMAASSVFCSMPDANSSLLNIVRAFFMATSIVFCPMLNAYSSFDDIICTPFELALFGLHLGPMLETLTSIQYKLCTPISDFLRVLPGEVVADEALTVVAASSMDRDRESRSWSVVFLLGEVLAVVVVAVLIVYTVSAWTVLRSAT
eukprot:scaffold5620_cov162-Skeletonema_marinoi.AAC.8